MAEQRLSHAYLLVGPEGPERDAQATRLAAALLCRSPKNGEPCGECRDCRKVFEGVHPDVIPIERVLGDKGRRKQEILVDQIRAAAADAVVAPNEAERKVYLIREADRMNEKAQNALLKALEDPPGHACFLLCAAAADALLPTVRSRVVRRDGSLRDDGLPALSELCQGYLDAAASGKPSELARWCFLRSRLGREEADELLAELETALGDILCGRRSDPGLGRERLLSLLTALAELREYLRRNISPKQVFGLLAVENDLRNDTI